MDKGLKKYCTITFNNKVFCLALIFFLVSSRMVFAQLSENLFFHRNLLQAVQLNPAVNPGPPLTIGIFPTLSLDMYSDLRFDDVAIKSPDGQNDDYVSPYYSEYYTQEFLGKLQQNNATHIHTSITLLSLGMELRYRDYLSFSLSQHARSSNNIPRDAFRFLEQNPPIDTRYNMDELDSYSAIYTELACSYSRDWSDKLRLGLTLKYLMGGANISADVKVMDFRSDNYYSAANTDFTLYFSGPFTHEYNEKNEWQGVTMNENISLQDFLFKNTGMAISLGLQYKLLENCTLDFSILDLGYINWTNNATHIRYYGQHEFNAIDITDNNINNLSDELKKYWQEMKDSLQQEVKNQSYKSPLSPSINIGLGFELSPELEVGFLTRTVIVNELIRQSLHFSANYQPKPWLYTTLSLNHQIKNYWGIGLATTIQTGKIQYFAALDYFPPSFVDYKQISYIPNKVRNLSFSFGINLLFVKSRNKFRNNNNCP